jgi:hypothetical protein
MANTPPPGTELAIPNFTGTTNISEVTGTYEVIFSNQSNTYMNGNYITTSSSSFFDGINDYGSHNCFERNGIPILSDDGTHYSGPHWLSQNNNYESGIYTGTTATNVGGNNFLGEYVKISAPYSFILKSYSLISSNYDGNTEPIFGWVIGGSNNGGLTYTLLDQVEDTFLLPNSYQLFEPINTTAYSTYIIIITNSSSAKANIGTWNIYSLPPVVPPVVPISNSCFPQKTPIITNQGNVFIENIDINKHTIRNKKIIAITKTIITDKYMVCFEKDSLGKNIPCEKTVISKNHLILYMGKMIKSDYFIKHKFDNVYKVKYSGEILYNVLLENYDKMIVNNIICETLHPNNTLAKFYMFMSRFKKDTDKNYLIKEYNTKRQLL